MKITRFVLRIILALMIGMILAQAVHPARASAPAASLAQQAGKPVAITLADWGYEDVTLYGPYGSAVYSLGLPAHWEVQPGSIFNLELDFSMSRDSAYTVVKGINFEDYVPAIVVQVLLNGELVYTVNEVVMGHNSIPISLPNSWPQPEGEVNRLEIIMTIHGHCELFAVSTLVIKKESNMAFTFAERPLALDLASYPRPFYQRSFLPDIVSIVIPAKPTMAEVETALAIAARLGTLTNNRVAITTLTDADVKAQAGGAAQDPWAENMILVGTPTSNSIIGDLLKTANLLVTAPSGSSFSYNGSPVAESDGILQLVESPKKPGKAVLMVTGLADEAVRKAGRALNMPALFPGKSGPIALVQDVLPGKEPDAAISTFTLADLGYNDEIFVGLGVKYIFYQFTVPFDWVISPEAGVRLFFSHSSMLDPKQSSISLFLNDKPIATVALDESNAINGELTAQIDARNVRLGLNNTLLVQIEGEFEDPCIIPETSQAWVSISADSIINLAHSKADVKGLKDLDYWPQAFVTEPDLKNVMLSLPQQPTTAEWNYATKIAMYLGASSGIVDTQMKVLLGEAGAADLSGYQIVAIGRPTRNPVLQAVNDVLPQPFLPGTDSIQQKVDTVIFRLAENLDLGYLELIPSPWNKDNVLLALTGTSDAAVELASRYLVSSDLVWQLRGDLALVRGDKVFVTDTRAQTASGAAQFTATVVPEAAEAEEIVPTPEVKSPNLEPVDLTPPQTNMQRYPFILPAVAGGGGLLALFLLIAGIVKGRKNK